MQLRVILIAQWYSAFAGVVMSYVVEQYGQPDIEDQPKAVAIFHVAANEPIALSEASSGAEGVRERKDLRIDPLCIDQDANPVVPGLKRTGDGGHMQLPALRDTAMISAMRFEQMVATFARYRNKACANAEESRPTILEFLYWEHVRCALKH